MHTKQNPANFKIKHREATRKWGKNKIADTESNFNDQTLSQTATNSPAMHKQLLGKALKHVNNVWLGSPL